MRFVCGVLVGCLAFSAWGQQAVQQGAQRATPPPPAPPASLAPDPVVHADRTVTFTFRNATAHEVALALEGVAHPIPMSKGATGDWTLTTEVLKPEIYGYHFEVDGQYTVDAHNVLVKSGVLTVGSNVLVPGAAPEPWEHTDVPHGEVHQEFFTTKVAKGLEHGQDQFFVYTPPGYDARASTKYPVLYLLHGWSDTAAGWSSTGQANDILDNLIAAGKAKPMIVVMPLGYGEMSFVYNGWGEWQKPVDIDRNTNLFQESLLTEVMPRVNAEYDVATGHENTAIAGLSMGGLEALSIGLNHTGMFAYVGGFSAAVHKLEPANLSGLKAKTADLKELWISCGTEDGLIEANRKLSTYLKGEGLAVQEVETPGMHTWLVWRDNLVNFVQLLFAK